MTNNVSATNYDRFNRRKALANLREMTVRLAAQKTTQEQNVNINVSPEKTISHEKD